VHPVHDPFLVCLKFRRAEGAPGPLEIVQGGAVVLALAGGDEGLVERDGPLGLSIDDPGDTFPDLLQIIDE
jgi:hypothetical protein